MDEADGGGEVEVAQPRLEFFCPRSGPLAVEGYRGLTDLRECLVSKGMRP